MLPFTLYIISAQQSIPYLLIVLVLTLSEIQRYRKEEEGLRWGQAVRPSTWYTLRRAACWREDTTFTCRNIMAFLVLLVAVTFILASLWITLRSYRAPLLDSLISGKGKEAVRPRQLAGGLVQFVKLVS